MESFARPARREVELFQDTPVMMLQARFRKPMLEALPKARQTILKWAQEQYPEVPPAAFEGKAFDLDRAGDPLRVIVPTGDANTYWALRLNRIDQEVAGRVWTVEAHLASDGSRAHFGFRLSVLSDGGHLIRPPRFIRELDERIGLQVDGFPLDGRLREVGAGKGTDALISLIEREGRTAPVVVFSTDSDGQCRSKAAKGLATMARGIAHVFAIDQEASFQLTRRFGKALSTFNGAVRVYPTHFTAHGDPFSMPLYLTPRIEKVNDQRLTDWLLADVCGMSTGEFATDQLPRFSTLRKTQTRYELNKAQADAASSATNSSEQVQALMLQISKFAELETLFNESLGSAEAAAKIARAEADEFRSENYRLRAHVESLMAAMREQGTGQQSVPIPDSYEDLQTWAEQYYPTAIAITNKAARLAAAGEFEDVETVYKALQLLATEYRDSKMGVDGAYDRFEAGLQELGLKITPAFANGSAGAADSAAIQKYRGVNRVMDWHLKNGGNTRDPARCLRIYFFWSDEDQRCVVGALPGHVTTVMS